MEYLAELHSKIIHFPISFLIIYPIIEIIAFVTRKDFFYKAALLILFIGVLGALGAVLTGNQAFYLNNGLSGKSLELFNSHELNANITVWSFTFLLIIRYYLTIKQKLRPKFHLIILILAIAGMYFVYQTGYYGAELAESIIKSVPDLLAE